MRLRVCTTAVIQILLPFPSSSNLSVPQSLDLSLSVGFMQPSRKQLCFCDLLKKDLRASHFATWAEEGKTFFPVALQTHCTLEMVVWSDLPPLLCRPWFCSITWKRDLLFSLLRLENRRQLLQRDSLLLPVDLKKKFCRRQLCMCPLISVYTLFFFINFLLI